MASTDISKLSNDDLRAISNGDMASVSDYGLRVLAGETAVPPAQTLTQEQIEDQAKKAFKSSARAESPILSNVADFLAGATSVPRGAVNMISPDLANRIFPMRGVDKESGVYTAGQIADPSAMAIGVGGMKAAQALTAIPKVGARLAAPITQGMLGGAIGGAGVGALSEDASALTGGMFGGAIGAALPVVGRGAGYAVDRLSGSTPALRAKEVIGKAYGESLPMARQLWQQAPSDLTAAQAAAPTQSTVGAALGKRAETMQSQVFRDIADAQKSAQLSEIAGVSGGQTQQAARSAQKTSKGALTAQTNPMREAELDAANMGWTYLKDLQARAAQKGESLVDALQNQWKLSTDEAQAMVRFSEGKPGWLSNANYASQAREAADIFAKVKAQRGTELNFLQNQMDSLAAHGLKPLDVGKITGGLQAKLNDPKLAGNSIAENSMASVADEIAKWTAKNGGVIDAQALYAIRKNAVQSAVQKQLAGASPKVQSQAAAGALSAIEPLIDDAIISAGGSGWKNYLRTYAQGMNEINRLKLGAKAMDLYTKSPDAFMRLVESNSPEVVQKIFKSNSDVVTAMGQGYWPLAKVGSAMRRDAELADRAAAGTVELANLLKDNAAKTWVPKLIDWKLALAREAGDVLEGYLNKATMNKVYLAMRSGKSAEEIMNMVPAKERVQFLNILYSGRGTPIAAGAGQTIEGDQ